MLKACRSLEIGVSHVWMKKFDKFTPEELMEYIKEGTDDRIYAIAEIISRNMDIGMIHDSTKIDMFFLQKIKNIIKMEIKVKENIDNINVLKEAKKMGFSDKYIAKLWNKEEEEIYLLRKKKKIYPVYKMIDTCSSEFESYVPYFYSTYEEENESIVSNKKKIIVLGAGPIRIGQGVEFDYSTVHAVKTIKEAGFEAIIINNNPETVSTDYTTSDKLYFEPLTIEDVMNIIDLEKPEGVVATLGGQTAINLADGLASLGVKLIGTDVKAIERAENRDSFEKVMESLKLLQPKGKAVTNIEAGIKAAQEIGYPVLVRPSYVLGGRAMQIVSNKRALEKYLKSAVEINTKQPVLVDAVCDRKRCICTWNNGTC